MLLATSPLRSRRETLQRNENTQAVPGGDAVEGECVQASRGHASARQWGASLVLLIMLLIGTSSHLKDSRKGNDRLLQR